jgi:hypothetical protein
MSELRDRAANSADPRRFLSREGLIMRSGAAQADLTRTKSLCGSRLSSNNSGEGVRVADRTDAFRTEARVLPKVFAAAERTR